MSNTGKNRDQASAGPLSERVLKLVDIMKRLVAKGREPGFTVDEWAPLAELVDVERFERVGPFRDALNWQQYAEMLTQWVTTSEGWDPVRKRMDEVGRRVYLECEERVTNDGRVEPFHSLSVYEFDDAGKLTRIDVYMQLELDKVSGLVEKVQQL